MISSSNQTAFATLTNMYEAVNIPTATAALSYTLVCTGDTKASVITDILFRSFDGTARLFNIIICATGNQTTAANSRIMVSIPANAGNNGSTAIASLAALAPSLFDLDLSGNRIMTLESGQSVYVQNTTLTAGAFNLTIKHRRF